MAFVNKFITSNTKLIMGFCFYTSPFYISLSYLLYNKKIENTIFEIKSQNADKEKTKEIRKDIEEYKKKTLEHQEQVSERVDNKMKKILEKQKRKKEKQQNQENKEILQEAASLVLAYQDFTSFSKRNTQVKTFICQVTDSRWIEEDGSLLYQVQSNRFLRGMVRALVSTMLLVGREKLTLSQFREIIESRDCTKASFAAPAHGLFLEEVGF